MTCPAEITGFWIDETGPDGWYNGSKELDEAIRARFLGLWQQVQQNGGLDGWLTNPEGCLAYIILTDQFPRNMFRGSGQSFATDPLARAAAKMAIGRDWDLQIDEPARQFFYMPLEHSESQCDQDRAVRLIKTRLQQSSSGLLHAKAHREIIRRFGRFPFRNAVLGRASTQAEQAWIKAGAYAATLRDLQKGLSIA